jgi:hypothetical protein
MCDGIPYKRTVCKTLLFVGAAMSVNAVAFQAPAQRPIINPADSPKWEAVFIKPCGQAPSVGGGARGAGPGTARIPIVSPGQMNLTCTTVARLITQAYSVFQTEGAISKSRWKERRRGSTRTSMRSMR